jgi:hypothetical protein
MAYASYDIDTVDGISELRERMDNADTVEDWSFILRDYISSGNTKISNTTAIFNMNSAHDCPNFGTRENGESHTGYCQVPKEACYAAKAENMYNEPLPYRRRQEYLWDCMTPELWAKAFTRLNERKRKPFDSIRFSEAGDFRHNGDIVRVNTIAKMVDVPVYTYSASHKLNWSLSTNFTVNASNGRAEYGDRRFIAIGEHDEKPDSAVWCPNNVQQNAGVPIEERRKCGECKLCLNKEGPDVAIHIH